MYESSTDQESSINNSVKSQKTRNALGLVVLVGRPNVGKSALFNSLSFSRDALVGDQLGLTRDRRYGKVLWGSLGFTVIDCGGVMRGCSDALVREVAQQTEMAIAEADIILMVVDAQVGWLQEDLNLAKRLRKMGKPLMLALNKFEGLGPEGKAQFAALGIEDMYAVSAMQCQGLGELRKEIIAKLLKLYPNEQLEQDFTKISSPPLPLSPPKQKPSPYPLCDEKEEIPSVTFLGCPNVGKSTLINRIVGHRRLVASEWPGTTRDSIEVPFVRNSKEYVLIDTAGIRRHSRITEKVEADSVAKSLKAIHLADLVVLVIDAVIGPREQDLKLIEETLQAGKGLVIAVNKRDLVDRTRMMQVSDEMYRRLAFARHVPSADVSAETGEGITALWRLVDAGLRAQGKHISTARLNRILGKACNNHLAALANGKQVKLRYVHVGGKNPLQLIIHGTRVEGLMDSYVRYLENYFRRELRMAGFPIKISFKESHGGGGED